MIPPALPVTLIFNSLLFGNGFLLLYGEESGAVTGNSLRDLSSFCFRLDRNTPLEGVDPKCKRASQDLTGSLWRGSGTERSWPSRLAWQHLFYRGPSYTNYSKLVWQQHAVSPSVDDGQGDMGREECMDDLI